MSGQGSGNEREMESGREPGIWRKTACCGKWCSSIRPKNSRNRRKRSSGSYRSRYNRQDTSNFVTLVVSVMARQGQ
jgi:hypothetical protein